MRPELRNSATDAIAGEFFEMTPKHLHNTHSDHSSYGVIILMSYNHLKFDILSVSVCVCVLCRARHKQPLTFSHVTRTWLNKPVTWKTTERSYTKQTHKAKKNGQFERFSIFF